MVAYYAIRQSCQSLQKGLLLDMLQDKLTAPLIPLFPRKAEKAGWVIQGASSQDQQSRNAKKSLQATVVVRGILLLTVNKAQKKAFFYFLTILLFF